MSFSSDAKREITQKKLTKPCCARAACYGMACFAKYFDTRGIVIQTEMENVAAYAHKMFQRCGVQGETVEKVRPSGVLYEFAVKDPEQVARMHSLFQTTGEEVNLQIDPNILSGLHCVSAFVAAAFLCGGTATDPQKEYSLEFISNRTTLAKDFEALLAEHEFAPHRTRRKGMNLVYVKASDHVEDLLTFMGASNASLQLMNEKALKSVRNQVNRRSNCETANIGKTAAAYGNALKAIRYLEAEGALESLSAPLQEAARKRMENPGLTLAELAKTFTPEISKSGLSHRIKKLETIAADLQERKAKAAQDD